MQFSLDTSDTVISRLLEYAYHDEYILKQAIYDAFKENQATKKPEVSVQRIVHHIDRLLEERDRRYVG